MCNTWKVGTSTQWNAILVLFPFQLGHFLWYLKLLDKLKLRNTFVYTIRLHMMHQAFSILEYNRFDGHLFAGHISEFEFRIDFVQFIDRELNVQLESGIVCICVREIRSEKCFADFESKRRGQQSPAQIDKSNIISFFVSISFSHHFLQFTWPQASASPTRCHGILAALIVPMNWCIGSHYICRMARNSRSKSRKSWKYLGILWFCSAPQCSSWMCRFSCWRASRWGQPLHRSLRESKPT